jgi:hypothetical protein
VYILCLGQKSPSSSMDVIHHLGTPWGCFLAHLCWFNLVGHNKRTGGIIDHHD